MHNLWFKLGQTNSFKIEFIMTIFTAFKLNTELFYYILKIKPLLAIKFTVKLILFAGIETNLAK